MKLGKFRRNKYVLRYLLGRFAVTPERLISLSVEILANPQTELRQDEMKHGWLNKKISSQFLPSSRLVPEERNAKR